MSTRTLFTVAALLAVSPQVHAAGSSYRPNNPLSSMISLGRFSPSHLAAHGAKMALGRPVLLPVKSGTFSLPVSEFTLPNGLKVVVQEDHSSPTVAVTVVYRVGSQNERLGRSGFAHLFEHLMAQGTKSIKPRELSKLIEAVGGNRNASTGKTRTTYYSVVPKNALKLVLWAESERMHLLNIDQRALALERQVVLEEMRLRVRNKAYAQATQDGLGKALSLWENEHSVIGSAEDIRNATLEDVRSFYGQFYGPNNAVLTVAGDVTIEEVRQLAEEHYGAIPMIAVPPAPQVEEAPLAADQASIYQDPLAKMPLTVLAWKHPGRGDKDYWPLAVLSEILSSGEANPLYQSLVKQDGTALSANAEYPTFNATYAARGPELFLIQVLSKLDASREELTKKIDLVLQRFASAGPTTEELQSAQAQVELQWAKSLDALEQRASQLGSYAALIGDPSLLTGDLEKLLSVTAQDIQRAAREWLVGKHRVQFSVLPGEAAAPEVEPKTPETPAAQPRAPGDAPPEIGPMEPAKAPEIHRFKLSNGLQAVVVRNRRLPLLKMELMLKGGAISEKAGEEGLSSAAQQLLLKGAGDKDASALNQSFARLGYAIGAGGNAERAELSAEGLGRNAGAFFDQLGALLTGASYPKDEVALWQKNMVDEMKVSRAEPSFMAKERLGAELYPGHPYGRVLPSEDEISKVTSERLKEFHQRQIVPQNATMILVGDIDPEQAREMLENSLAGWTGSAGASKAPPLPDSGLARVSFVDRPGSSQANIVIALQVEGLTPRHPDFLAFNLMNDLLGGSSGRLFQNLRVQHGYIYGSYSRAEWTGDTLTWKATTEVRNEVVAASISEMEKEFERMRAEPVSAADLAAKKNYLKGQFLIRLSKLESSAASIASYEMTGRDSETEIRTYIQRLDAVTAEDIQRAAEKYLKKEKMLTIIVGDRAAIKLR